MSVDEMGESGPSLSLDATVTAGTLVPEGLLEGAGLCGGCQGPKDPAGVQEGLGRFCRVGVPATRM